jgi:hypothetical protein
MSNKGPRAAKLHRVPAGFRTAALKHFTKALLQMCNGADILVTEGYSSAQDDADELGVAG